MNAKVPITGDLKTWAYDGVEDLYTLHIAGDDKNTYVVVLFGSDLDDLTTSLNKRGKRVGRSDPEEEKP
jgi:hypothetical protein